MFLSCSFLINFLLVNSWRLLPKLEAQLENSSKFLIISISYDKLNYRNSFIPFVPRDKFKVWIDSYEISVIHTYYTLHIFYISGLLLLPSGVLNLYWIFVIENMYSRQQRIFTILILVTNFTKIYASSKLMQIYLLRIFWFNSPACYNVTWI